MTGLNTVVDKKHRTRTNAVSVSQLPRTADVEEELDWFFVLSEGDMGNSSNYETTLSRVNAESSRRTVDDCVEAAHRHSKILGRLRKMSKWDAGVLQVAYEPRGWPLDLREELGVLTALVVRLVCAEVGLPDDDHELKGLEETTAKQLDRATRKRGFGHLERVRVTAQGYLNTAHQAYAEMCAKEKREMQERRKQHTESKAKVQSTASQAAPPALPVRGFYKVMELARAMGVSRWRMAQNLKRAGVETYTFGGVPLVPLAELETKVKPVWEAIKAAEKARQGWASTQPTSPEGRS